MNESANIKVLISYSRKKELEEKEKELVRMKLGGFDQTVLVESICNHIEEFRNKFSGGSGGRAAQYSALDRLLKSVRDSYLEIPPITNRNRGY